MVVDFILEKVVYCDLWNICLPYFMAMQPYVQPQTVGYCSGMPSGGQYVSNQVFSIPTQNKFGPLNEWVGCSMGVQDPTEQMDWVAAQNKRRRFNTGTSGIEQSNFSTLSIDEKLSHMMDKLNSLEDTNQTLVKFSQSMNTVQGKVNSIENRMDGHELFLKTLAYKSIDLEARSRRRNLLFHGLAECRNEKLTELLRDFMWKEMGVDSDDLYIERVHRLGSFHKAKMRQNTDNPKRPIIISFQDYRSTELILDAAYMLKGTNFSVSRDYPKEIVAARRRLMPRYKAERQNRNNKVSIEYPAKLVVNGKVIVDEFADWYPVLERDRCQLLTNINNIESSRPSGTEIRQLPDNSYNNGNMQQAGPSNFSAEPTAQCVSNGREATAQPQQTRSYSQVVSSAARQRSDIVTTGGAPCTNEQTINTPINTPPLVSNVPRYAPTGAGAGNQTPQRTTTNTMNTINTTRNVHSDNNTSNNGNAARDQSTYLNL